MNFDTLLQMMVAKDASDLFITPGVPPSMKIQGTLQPIGSTPLTTEQSKQCALHLMSESQRSEFATSHELNFTLIRKQSGRFRVSAFYQQGHISMVLRAIKTQIPTTEQLLLPSIVKDLVMKQYGLILLVGGTGTGKSSTMAAMLGHRNKNSSGHIFTVEDPIEYVHEHINCIVSQREIGVDTESFETALKNALRQAPDVIAIGEIRSTETMAHALRFAQTGQLCIATLHANTTDQALDRIIQFFPEGQHQQVWLSLSLMLQAIIAQKLVPTVDGKRNRVVTETLINTPLMADAITAGKVDQAQSIMKKSNEQGMQTFDQSLYQLYSQGVISYETALNNADSMNNIRLMIKLDGQDGQNKTPKDKTDQKKSALSIELENLGYTIHNPQP